MSAPDAICSRCGAKRRLLTGWTCSDVVASCAAGKWISGGRVLHDGSSWELLQDACGNRAIIIDLPPGYWLDPRTGETGPVQP